jgi:3-oxoacyl-[acyl-carrier protein] reductase
MFDLTGKRALVTGASGDIGQAIARALHAQGATVGLTGTRREPMERLAADLRERAYVVVADLMDPEAIDALAADSTAVMGGVDILVNNAGISREDSTEATSDAAWQGVMDVNLTATFRLCRAVVPDMRRRHWGRIIGISSILAVTGCARLGHYAASKAAMIGLVKSMALELAADGITANCIAPGYIRTPMMGMNTPERLEHLLAHIPVGFFGAPDDVAVAAVYLASPQARFVTGATLHVNGGMAMV